MLHEDLYVASIWNWFKCSGHHLSRARRFFIGFNSHKKVLFHISMCGVILRDTKVMMVGTSASNVDVYSPEFRASIKVQLLTGTADNTWYACVHEREGRRWWVVDCWRVLWPLSAIVLPNEILK